MSSSLQAGLGNGWGEDGFQWPDWLDGFDEPVVRTTTKSRKKMHAPDLTSDDPRASCEIGTREHQTFIVAEREHIEDFYTTCGRPECQQWFDGVDQ